MTQFRIGIDLGGTKIEIAALGPDDEYTFLQALPADVKVTTNPAAPGAGGSSGSPADVNDNAPTGGAGGAGNQNDAQTPKAAAGGLVSQAPAADELAHVGTADQADDRGAEHNPRQEACRHGSAGASRRASPIR